MMEATELVDRYVNEVGQSLPRKTRSDIKLELRSLLLDGLEERAAASGKEPTVEMAAEMLKEYGLPGEMAARYRPERYLIGPQIFPAYRLILFIVLIAIAVALSIAFAITLITGGIEDAGSLGWAFLKAYVQGALMAFASLTIIFAVAERYYAHKIPSEADEEWDPLELEPVEEPNRLKRPEIVAGIVWDVILIALFNFFPRWIGLVESIGDGAVIIPLLAPEFAVYIPWLTAFWALGILFRLYLLWQGRWSRPARWMEFGLGLIGMAITYRIVTGGPITTLSWLDTIVRFFMWIGLLVGGIEAIVRLVRLAQSYFSGPADDVGDLKASF